MLSPDDKLREFLALSPQFRLGDLPTEQPHPLTGNLSTLSRENPAEALRIFHTLDQNALDVVAAKVDALQQLARQVGDTLHAGGSVFLTGCGSTGRLSLACEFIWRKEKAGTSLEDRVHAFMAGGDIAMIRSVESFEDHPEYGARQLEESGFKGGDLLIASTEGGETPFVIGATRRAAELSSRSPFFLYCNPDDILHRVAARSAAVLADPRIEKICLPTGPMALSGSTRLQASTVLMAAVGGALLAQANPSSLIPWLEQLIAFWKKLHTPSLSPFVENEARIYQAGGHLNYVSPSELGVTVLTDTTERAPTFSMHPFFNELEESAPPSLCSLTILSAPNRESAWRLLLGRNPRGLDWEHIGETASGKRLMGFDFSASPSRKWDVRSGPQSDFMLGLKDGGIELELGNARTRIPTGPLPMLSIHLVLKMILNAHSTLVMGRLGRFDGNFMTWVKPSNFKLIDRAIRYADQILQKKGVRRSYEQIAKACFDLRGMLGEDRPLVFAMVEKLSNQTESGNNP